MKRWVLCQSQLPETIVKRAGSDCVVLVIVDGLGLADWKRFAPTDFLAMTEPCFFDGISITEHGMKPIVGNPPIAVRLAEWGYERSFGFSYWERAENELTDRLFFGITEGARKVRSFDEVLKALEWTMTANRSPTNPFWMPDGESCFGEQEGRYRDGYGDNFFVESDRGNGSNISLSLHLTRCPISPFHRLAVILNEGKLRERMGIEPTHRLLDGAQDLKSWEGTSPLPLP